ncbi:MAG: hypothetical protein HY654_10645 [Acidobacteria bacterium]|nr:hypothetical protein [Acidobacteriota bacterium]
MESATHASVESNEPVQIRVLGPDKHAVALADLVRLFPNVSLTRERSARVLEGPCFAAICGERVVGAAAYHRTDVDLRVTDLGVAADCCRRDDVISALLDALELACLAGGSERLVFRVPEELSPLVLQRRGYVITNGCEGCWAEKSYY